MAVVTRHWLSQKLRAATSELGTKVVAQAREADPAGAAPLVTVTPCVGGWPEPHSCPRHCPALGPQRKQEVPGGYQGDRETVSDYRRLRRRDHKIQAPHHKNYRRAKTQEIEYNLQFGPGLHPG